MWEVGGFAGGALQLLCHCNSIVDHFAVQTVLNEGAADAGQGRSGVDRVAGLADRAAGVGLAGETVRNGGAGQAGGRGEVEEVETGAG